jgi:hypothetical protein
MRSVFTAAILCLFFIAATVWVNAPSQAAGGSIGEAKVRLYSDGQVVGEWLAVGAGRVEGATFVFPIRKGTRDLEVRISGIFSFEQQP